LLEASGGAQAAGAHGGRHAEKETVLEKFSSSEPFVHDVLLEIFQSPNLLSNVNFQLTRGRHTVKMDGRITQIVPELLNPMNINMKTVSSGSTASSTHGLYEGGVDGVGFLIPIGSSSNLLAAIDRANRPEI
jgi:hypothetical protein